MDDYEPWLTPCDPDFDPEKCESAYALRAVKEEGEPVKFLEASITDNLDYPSGYWFFWRTISFSEETGRLIEGEWGGAGDIPRRQPSQPPSSCSKVSRLIPIGGPAISALPVREALFYRLAARQSSRSGNTVVPP